MPWAGLEPAIPATKRAQTNALDRAATGIRESQLFYHYKIILYSRVKGHEPLSNIQIGPM
jgi:hypothetical protein